VSQATESHRSLDFAKDGWVAFFSKENVMKLKNAALTALVAAVLATTLSTTVSAAAITNTLDASNSGSGTTYWAPTDADKLSTPYYRGNGEDWAWQHGAISGKFSSATLSVSAYDVDALGEQGRLPEVDEIYAFNNNTATWNSLGNLAGSNNTFSFTTFNLSSSWFDEIALGLQVMMKIDQNNDGIWAVSLAKSSLAIDGGSLPNPNPGQVPVPAAFWLFGSGLAGLIGMHKKSKLVK
jgi:hypothetical protein